MPSKPTAKIVNGDCIAELDKMDDESIDCVVTSPPYFGLRDYGTGEWSGGDPGCDHVEKVKTKTQGNPQFNEGRPSREATVIKSSLVCSKCGADKKDYQIGLEETPGGYIGKMVEVFSRIHRVLKPSGTVWINIGDSYAGSWGAQSKNNTCQKSSMDRVEAFPETAKNGNVQGVKPKELIGIPWRLAFALQDFGFYLRQDIIWHKPAPMPESVKDRCTRSHEYIFLLTKSKKYFFDSEAISEPAKYADEIKHARTESGLHSGESHNGSGKSTRKFKSGGACFGKQSHSDSKAEQRQYDREEYVTRNKRSVWTVGTANYKGAHFAVFPEKLIEPCILAGCPEGGVVLDPFSGSGTTCFTARKLGRDSIGIELNPDYVELSEKRLAQNVLF